MKIVVNGASIAGLSAAVSLSRTGHEVLLIERARSVRSGGIAVDVREGALEVAQRLGVLEQLKASRVGYGPQFEFVDAAGEVRASIDPNADIYENPDDLEIARDELVRILESQLPSTVTRCFGTSVDHVEHAADGRIQVSIEGREPDTVDLVIGADGLHSRIRRIAFGPERDYLRYLGLYVGVLRRCATPIAVPATTVYNEPGTLVLVRGDGQDTSAVLGFSSEWIDYDYHDDSVGRELVAQAFADVQGWKAPDLVAELPDSSDFYFDSVCQVVMPKWHQGRCVLIGDAGYCASFFSGMGTTLAMRGAQMLADALNSEPTIEAALCRYDDAMRPVVTAAQATAQAGIDLLFPRTADEIDDRNDRLRLAPPTTHH